MITYAGAVTQPRQQMPPWAILIKPTAPTVGVTPSDGVQEGRAPLNQLRPKNQ
ncbi:hypothetical protein J6590_034233 [Homalodisca vitripennis]|nr:hypothetical protein J6590_034233 [Homalodisca vitripennis]